MLKINFCSRKWIALLCLLLTGCMVSAKQKIDAQYQIIQPLDTQPINAGISQTEITITKIPEANRLQPISNFKHCKLGMGLREETKDLLLENRMKVGLLLAGSSRLAEMYFPMFDGSIRILGAPSLSNLENKASRARDADLPYEALGYGLETSVSTPQEEWRDIMGSTEKAEALSNEYGKLLLLAPGFRLMSNNEALYKPMAAKGDIWILQTQQLQKSPPGPDFRQEVARIVSLIRSGNPEIVIWAQITLPPDREPDAEEWLAYRELIVDLVDGTYIGVYTWDIFEETELLREIEAIISSVCTDNLAE